MSDIGIKDLVNSNVNEIDNLVTIFIKSSLNIREDISKKGTEIKKHIRMIENRIGNMLNNIIPTVTVATRHFRVIPSQYETKHGKIIVPLTYVNYSDLLDNIDDMTIRHRIESQYIS